MTEPRKPRKTQEKAPGIKDLEELALDMRWSWIHESDPLWARIDPELWEITHNPWLVFEATTASRLKLFLKEEEFKREVARLRELQLRTSGYGGGVGMATWFEECHPSAKLKTVAYFSMEFGLNEALPIYSGGLGNVAGDQLKAASDLGVPVIGVGLLYQQGYFRQVIDSDGSQRALSPYNDPSLLPVRPLRDRAGERLRMRVDLPGCVVWLRIWEVKVGRVRLLLIDSNDPANPAVYRGVTSELYGGGTELRLQQETILGISGYRLLHTLGIHPEVCHLNEGHAAFAILERARIFMEETGYPFQTALLATRPGNVFTTHTPVAAGIDQFPAYLCENYLNPYATDRLKVGLQELLALGRINPDDPHEPFNMAYLGIRGSGFVNGVSQLHAEVSRKMFSPLFPQWPIAEVPVDSITNGVHSPTWHSRESDALWTKCCGPLRWRMRTIQDLEKCIRTATDEELWNMRCANRAGLVEAVRRRYQLQESAAGLWSKHYQDKMNIFDPNVLTLGFARRFATYKRPNLLLRNPERLARILTSAKFPVQLAVAGKAHPQDREGQEMIREWVQFTRWKEVRGRVVFLSDYDLNLAKELVQGVDVWINTPRRPWEACGTSGMKVLISGGLNVSTLDGWWAEAYDPMVGWKVGDQRVLPTECKQDENDAEQLYSVLEKEVIPLFYKRNEAGIPSEWVSRMRESMARLVPRFSALRCVREYTDRAYLPAAEAFLRRSQGKGAPAAEMQKWQTHLRAHWSELRIQSVETKAEDGQMLVTAQVYLGAIPAEHVRVEVFAENHDGAPFVEEMTRVSELIGAKGGFVFKKQIPDSRPADAYTVRVVGNIGDLATPLEEPLILWHR